MPLLSPIKKLFENRGFKKYFFNTGWLMADKVLRLFVGLFVGVYVARYLGPEKFGILQFSMSFVALFGAFAKLGLDGIVVRNAVQDPDSRDELLGTAFGLRIIGGMVLLAVVFGAIQLTDSDPLTQFIVMIIAAGHVLQAFQVIEFYFQSQVLARLASIAGICGLLVSSAIKLALIWSGASLIWFAWVMVVEHGLKGLVLASLYIKQRIPLWRWRFRLSQARILLRDSWPLILSGIAVSLSMKVDQVMLKVMLNAEEVGYYAAGVKLSEALNFIPHVVMLSTFPLFVDLYQKKEKFWKRYNEMMFYGFWGLIVTAMIISLSSNHIINFIYGLEYKNSAVVLSLYVWILPLTLIGTMTGRYLLILNRQKLLFVRQALMMTANVGFNLLLIPLLGTIGACLSTVVPHLIVNFIFDFFYKDLKSLGLLKINMLIFNKKHS